MAVKRPTKSKPSSSAKPGMRVAASAEPVVVPKQVEVPAPKREPVKQPEPVART